LIVNDDDHSIVNDDLLIDNDCPLIDNDCLLMVTDDDLKSYLSTLSHQVVFPQSNLSLKDPLHNFSINLMKTASPETFVLFTKKHSGKSTLQLEFIKRQ
jgi:hypothetical protein